MNRNRIWIGVLIVALATVVSGAATRASAEDQVTVIGVLEQIKYKMYLITETEKFMVVGQDFSRLVGRKVKATGTIIENNRGKSMVVSLLEIVRN